MKNKKLDWKGQDLGTLDKETFSKHNSELINELIIENCRIELIASNAFTEFANIRNMHFDCNEIDLIGEGAFNGLGLSLQTLFMNGNRIRSISPVEFEGLEKLNLPSFYNYETMVINNLIFDEKLTNLTQLILRNSGIEWIKPGVFSHLTSLREIDLSFNKIQYLPKQTFSECKKLRLINMSANLLESFDWTCLGQLKQLEELNLSLNYFKTILNMDAFVRLKDTLVKINLFKNLNTDATTLFSEVFVLNIARTAVRLNDFRKVGSFILHRFRGTNSSFKLTEQLLNYEGTSLDFMIQNMRLSPSFLSNLVALLKECIVFNNITEHYTEENTSYYRLCDNKGNIIPLVLPPQDNYAIQIDKAASFVELCRHCSNINTSINTLGYMLRMNRSEVIQHDFLSYYTAALDQDNEAVAVCVLNFQRGLIESETRDFGDSIKSYCKNINLVT
jgi:Leucine-rich repeat (LRR) protein